jgi:urea transporter
VGGGRRLLGALLGALASGILRTWNRVETSHGLAGANLAIIGASCAFVAPEALRPLTVLIAVIVCLALEAGMRRLLQPLGLPILSFPAAATLLLLTSFHGAFGQPFWAQAGGLHADMITIAAPILLFASATAIKSWRAAALAGVLTGAAAILSGYVLNDGWLGPLGLWAFTVAPAAFGVYAVFLAGSRIGAVCGVGAAVLGTAIWAGWMASPLADSTPPLLIPFIFATWITLGAVRLGAGPTLLDPHVWAAVEEIRHAKSIGRPAMALTGGGSAPPRASPITPRAPGLTRKSRSAPTPMTGSWNRSAAASSTGMPAVISARWRWKLCPISVTAPSLPWSAKACWARR